MPPEPACPERWDCTYVYNEPPYDGPWWETSAGTWVAILGIIVLAVVLCTMTYYWWQWREAKLDDARRERERRHNLAIEEQRTMQLDAAKGNADLLRMVRESHR